MLNNLYRYLQIKKKNKFLPRCKTEGDVNLYIIKIIAIFKIV